jgi:hypothetical protein
VKSIYYLLREPRDERSPALVLEAKIGDLLFLLGERAPPKARRSFGVGRTASRLHVIASASA